MIDIVGLIAPNILWILAIVIGGTLISISVHFISVGGAPAAMAQATGIGTGTVMLAAGAGIAGIIAAGAVMDLNNAGFILLENQDVMNCLNICKIISIKYREKTIGEKL